MCHALIWNAKPANNTIPFYHSFSVNLENHWQKKYDKPRRKVVSLQFGGKKIKSILFEREK